jgi:hypothetical protein
MTSPTTTATAGKEKCTTPGSCTRTLTLLLQYKNSKVRRDKIIVSSLSELEQFIRQELQIPTLEELILRYYDSDFDENVDLESLVTLPDKAKLEGMGSCCCSFLLPFSFFLPPSAFFLPLFHPISYFFFKVIPKDAILASPSLSTTHDQVAAASVYPSSPIPSASPVAVGGFFPPPPLNVDPQLHLMIQQQLLEQGFVPPTVAFGALPFPPFLPPSPSVLGGVGGFAYPYNGVSEEEQVLLLQLQQLQLQQKQLQIESSQFQQQFFQPFDSTSSMAGGGGGGGGRSTGGDEDEDGGFTSPMMDSGTGEGWMVAKPPSSSSPSSAGILASSSSSSSKTSTGSLSPIDGSPTSSPAIGRRLSQPGTVPPSSQREGPKVPPKNLSAFIKSISLSPLKKSIVFKVAPPSKIVSDCLLLRAYPSLSFLLTLSLFYL